jgi:hypothetical protein
MSREVPGDIGELSRHALREAVDKVDHELADAPEDVRKAVAVIRLVTDIPRRAPWYGVPMDPGDSSVTVGVVLRNLVECSWGTEHERERLRLRLAQGKASYSAYLDRLLDPERYQAECAGQRLAPWQLDRLWEHARSLGAR